MHKHSQYFRNLPILLISTTTELHSVQSPSSHPHFSVLYTPPSHIPFPSLCFWKTLQLGYGSVVNVGLGVGSFDGETVGDLVGTRGVLNMKGKNDYVYWK